MTLRPSDFVDAVRLDAHIAEMAEIGATARGGVDRPALSPEDGRAQALMTKWGRERGMLPTRDPIGNFFLLLPGTDPAAPVVISGSHLDSQPTGGRYDGAYGVLAALSAVEAIHDSGLRCRHGIVVASWTNEEGSRYAPSMMGSALFAGARDLEETLAVRDSAGISVRECLEALSHQLPDIPICTLGQPVHAYVEAHIEQGPLLEAAGIPVGVVTGIQGKHTFRITVEGEASHAGTAPRAGRKDALLAATAMIQALTQVLHDAEDVVKFTVGRLEVEPNVPSVVPRHVRFSIDLRHPDSATLRHLSAQVGPICQSHAGPCEVTVEQLIGSDSNTFPPEMQACVRDAAKALGIPSMDMPSLAGHDARYLARLAPAAMIFVPCHLGITHNEAESAESSDLVAGTRVLADVLYKLAL